MTLFPCEGSARQRWAFNDAGELQLAAMEDGALCVSRRATAKTGVLELAPCGGGNTGNWAVDGTDGAVVDALTGRCLVVAADDPGVAVDAPCWAPGAYEWQYDAAAGELKLRDMCLTAGWPFLQWGAFATPGDGLVVIALNEAPRPVVFDIDVVGSNKGGSRGRTDADTTTVVAAMPARSIQTYVLAHGGRDVAVYAGAMRGSGKGEETS